MASTSVDVSLTQWPNNNKHTNNHNQHVKTNSVLCVRVRVCVCSNSMYTQNQCVDGLRSKVYRPMFAVQGLRSEVCGRWSEVCARRVGYDKSMMQSVVLRTSHWMRTPRAV